MYKINGKLIIIAGGGSGGHLFPAIAIGDELEKYGYTVRYIGSKFGIESKIFKNLDKSYDLLKIKGIHRSYSFQNILDNLILPLRLIFSLYKTIKIFKNMKPNIVIGTGGYASGIPLLASKIIKTKSIIHEQNSFPGLTTRKFSNLVNKVCITNEECNKYLNCKTILTGLPIRNNIKKIGKDIAKENLGLSKSKKTIFILGGSQGSKVFNEYFLNNYQFYIENNIQLIWQCGHKNINLYNEKISDKNIILRDFFDEISIPYSASDLIISRSGAVTINEIALLKKTMILVPLETSAGNHQLYNAKSFSDNNAALLIEQNDFYHNYIKSKVINLINSPTEQKEMSENAYKIVKKNALKNIVSEVIKLDKNYA